MLRRLAAAFLASFTGMGLVLGTLFWARQKLLSPTPRTAFADPAPLLAQDGAGELGR